MQFAARTLPTSFRPGRLLPGLLLLAWVATVTAFAAPETVAEWHFENAPPVAGLPTETLGAPHATAEGLGFDGVDDGLLVDANPLAGAQAFTIEVLIRPDADGAAEQRFFHIEDERHSRVLLETRLRPDGRWALDTFLLSGAERLTLLDPAKTHPSGTWSWVALTYASGVMRSYVDGVPELEGPVQFAPMATGRTSIGVRQTHNYWFKGLIREIRIHSRALLPAELNRFR